jgi:secreted Zn-dependent insulinase-like peptidase
MHALGSGKYPGEAYFKNFAGENGGKTNAFTASEGNVLHFIENNSLKFHICENKKATCYQLAIMGQQNYEKLLDIFSNLFIDAQFEESGTERQLAAVDSEYDLRKESFAVGRLFRENVRFFNHRFEFFARIYFFLHKIIFDFEGSM